MRQWRPRGQERGGAGRSRKGRAAGEQQPPAPSHPACRRQPTADLPGQGRGFSQRSFPRESGIKRNCSGGPEPGARGRPGGNPKPPQLFPVCRAAERRGAQCGRRVPPSLSRPSLRAPRLSSVSVALGLSLFFSHVSLSRGIQEIIEVSGPSDRRKPASPDPTLLVPPQWTPARPFPGREAEVALPARNRVAREVQASELSVRTVERLHPQSCQGLWGHASLLSPPLLLHAPDFPFLGMSTTCFHHTARAPTPPTQPTPRGSQPGSVHECWGSSTFSLQAEGMKPLLPNDLEAGCPGACPWRQLSDGAVGEE